MYFSEITGQYNYYCFHFCLTGQFFRRLLQVRPDVYRLDDLPVTNRQCQSTEGTLL